MISDYVSGEDWCVPIAFAAALGIDNTKEVSDLLRDVSWRGRNGYLEDSNGNITGVYNWAVYRLLSSLGLGDGFQEYAFRGNLSKNNRNKRLVSDFFKKENSGIWVISVRVNSNEAHALCIDLNDRTVLDSYLTRKSRSSLDNNFVKNYFSRKRLYWVSKVSD